MTTFGSADRPPSRKKLINQAGCVKTSGRKDQIRRESFKEVLIKQINALAPR
jgi:hypothetical protein